jgi:hypothetical protein
MRKTCRIGRVSASPVADDRILSALVGPDDLQGTLDDDVELRSLGALVEEQLAPSHAAPRAMARDACDLVRCQRREGLLTPALGRIWCAGHGVR